MRNNYEDLNLLDLPQVKPSLKTYFHYKVLWFFFHQLVIQDQILLFCVRAAKSKYYFCLSSMTSRTDFCQHKNSTDSKSKKDCHVSRL